MKAHEETWWADVDGNPGEVYAEGLRGRVAEFWFDSEGASGSDRAKLAAQAPAMARLLLKIRWASGAKEFEEMQSILKAAGVLP